MSYSYVSAKVREKSLDADWVDKDLSSTFIYLLYSNYENVILTLSVSYLQSYVYLDMSKVRNYVPPGNVNLTVSQWLIGLGNKTIPYTTNEPNFLFNSVKYDYLWNSGYNVKPVDHTKSVNANIPISSCPDLILFKDKVDFIKLSNYCLISVNGFFHLTVGSGSGLYVIDGAKTGRISNDTRIGIYSFNNVCDIKIIPIIPNMIYKAYSNQNFSDNVNIALSEPIGDRIPIVSIGGYLHVLDNSYRITGVNSLSINISNFALPDRIYDSIDKIDLSSLGLSKSSKNKYQISVNELYSDNVIRNYFSLSQSFIILMNTPSIYVKKHNLEKTNIPGEFINNLGLQLPMFGSLGRVHEYVPCLDNNKFICQTVPVIENNYLFRTTNWKGMASIDNQKRHDNPFSLQRANLLEFGTYLN